jgi:hypothetical protein
MMTPDSRTIEANVTVNHAVSVITTEPIEFPEQGFIAVLDNKTSLAQQNHSELQ